MVWEVLHAEYNSRLTMDRRQNLGENNSQYCTADSDVRGQGDPSERRTRTQNTDVVSGAVLPSQTNHSIGSHSTPNTAIDTRGERPVESTAAVAFSDPAEIVNPGTPPFSDNFPAFIPSALLDSLVHSLDDEKYALPRLSQNTSYYYQSQNNNYASDNILFYNNNNDNEYIYKQHAVVQWSNNPSGYSDTFADNRIFGDPWNGQYPPHSSAQLWAFQQQLQQHAGGQSQTNPPASVVQQYRDNGSSKIDVIGNYYPSAYVPRQSTTTATSTAVLSGPTGPAAAGYHGPPESSADDTDVMLSRQQYLLPVLEGELDDLLGERTDGCRHPSESPSEMSRSNRNNANLHDIASTTWCDRPPAAPYPPTVGQTDFDRGSQQLQQSRRFDNSSPRTPTAALTAAHRVNAMDDGVGGSSSSGPNPTNDNGADGNRLRTTDVGLSPALHQLAKETDPKSSVPSRPLADDGGGATAHDGRLAVQHLLPSQMVVEDPPTAVVGNVSLPPSPPPAGRPIIGGEASAAPVAVATTSAPVLSWSLSNFVPTPIASTGKGSTSARPNRVNNRSAKANGTIDRLGGARPSNPVVKRLQCKVCAQSFSYPHEFKQHKKVHTGVNKLYTCLKCGKPFVELFLLEAHDFTIH